MGGDAIVIIKSSCIHANGLTLARKITEKVDGVYLKPLSDGNTFGESLLQPTSIYVGLIDDLHTQNVPIKYAVNITGHGWRKLIANQTFEYVIEEISKPQPVFDFIQKYGPVDDYEAYGNFNMGAGFALYVSHDDVNRVIDTANNLGFKAMYSGWIKASTEKKVMILPKKLEYHGSTLAVR